MFVVSFDIHTHIFKFDKNNKYSKMIIFQTNSEKCRILPFFEVKGICVCISEYLLMFYYLSTQNSHVYNLGNLHSLTKFIPPHFFKTELDISIWGC